MGESCLYSNMTRDGITRRTAFEEASIRWLFLLLAGGKPWYFDL